MNIGHRIKERRELLGMSQDELAKKVGYKSRSSVNKIESDGRGLPQTKIVAFANALETTPAYLMGWEADPDRGTEKDVQERFVDFVVKQTLGQLSIPTSDETHLARLRGLIMHFERLNVVGQLEAINRIKELTYVGKYVDRKMLEASNKHDFYVRNLRAAHARTDIKATKEMIQNDDDIMNDENF